MIEDKIHGLKILRKWCSMIFSSKLFLLISFRITVKEAYIHLVDGRIKWFLRIVNDFFFNECRTWPIIYICFRFGSSWKNSLRDLSSYQASRSRMCSLYKLNPPGWNSDSTYGYGSEYGYGKNPINLLNYYSIVLALITGIISIGFFYFRGANYAPMSSIDVPHLTSSIVFSRLFC